MISLFSLRASYRYIHSIIVLNCITDTPYIHILIQQGLVVNSLRHRYPDRNISSKDTLVSVEDLSEDDALHLKFIHKGSVDKKGKSGTTGHGDDDNDTSDSHKDDDSDDEEEDSEDCIETEDEEESNERETMKGKGKAKGESARKAKGKAKEKQKQKDSDLKTLEKIKIVSCLFPAYQTNAILSQFGQKLFRKEGQEHQLTLDAFREHHIFYTIF